MSLENKGVKISCESCSYVALDDKGGFAVSVPLSIADAEVSGTAKLHCVLGPGSHKVELVEWAAEGHLPGEALEEVRQRVSRALGFIAERRICGNRHICPAEVIRVVKKQGNK